MPDKRNRDKFFITDTPKYNWDIRMKYGTLFTNRTHCFYCRRKFAEMTLTKNLDKTTDHFIALNRGGFNNEENKVEACFECNQWKAGLLPMEWFMKVKKFHDKPEHRMVNRGSYEYKHYGFIMAAIRSRMKTIDMKKASMYNY